MRACRASVPSLSKRSGLASTQARAVSAGVPGSIVHDRTKTVVRRHFAPVGGAAAPGGSRFADHNGFPVDVAAAHRPQAKGPRVS